MMYPSKIYKYPLLPGLNEIEIPVDSFLVHCGVDGAGSPSAYFQVPSGQEKKTTEDLLLVGTGMEFDGKCWKHQHTFNDGVYVWHIFTRIG